MGDIGTERKHIELEPLTSPHEVPVEPAAPTPAPEPVKVPEKEPAHV